MGSLAAAVLALIAVALLVNLARGGWAGVGFWLRAKFLGQAPPAQPYGSKAPPATAPSAGGIGVAR